MWFICYSFDDHDNKIVKQSTHNIEKQKPQESIISKAQLFDLSPKLQLSSPSTIDYSMSSDSAPIQSSSSSSTSSSLSKHQTSNNSNSVDKPKRQPRYFTFNISNKY